MNKLLGFLKEFWTYVLVIIIVLIIKAYVFTPIKVNGPSMNDTLLDGDIMILNEFGYRIGKIKRFDIVVVHYQNEYIIKRIIALPGEDVSYKNNKLYINGKYVKEDFLHKTTEDFDTIKVGKNEYFVMGDNRVNSTDSRIIGPVKKSDIRGHATFTVWPLNRFGSKN